MSDDTSNVHHQTDPASGDPEPEARQEATLDDAEVAEIREELRIEELMEEPPRGSLGVITDQDVPGAPG